LKVKTIKYTKIIIYQLMHAFGDNIHINILVEFEIIKIS